MNESRCLYVYGSVFAGTTNYAILEAARWADPAGQHRTIDLVSAWPWYQFAPCLLALVALACLSWWRAVVILRIPTRAEPKTMISRVSYED